ncbi:hypothetical protein L1987_44957 [Smallanthus sonchifolius]|uniref:Uncharacterized protein n=1 Tax=Smallanthus sonchifolius TaxID=185202 RepID=A0ACB9GS25_9ASTR|nr:hypothetical protein L1987_44957 [Smallanthus sonchifolius]
MSTELTTAPLCRWYKNPSYLLDQMLIFRISFPSLNSQSRYITDSLWLFACVQFRSIGSPLISQSAADEGSRTEIKGFGILSSVGREPQRFNFDDFDNVPQKFNFRDMGQNAVHKRGSYHTSFITERPMRRTVKSLQ